VSQALGTERSVLFISNDVVGERMAGPGIRCWELAKTLVPDCAVTLALPGRTSLSHPHIRTCSYKENEIQTLQALVAEAEIIILDTWSLDRLPEVPEDKFLVADIYDPFLLENLELFRERPLSERDRWNRNDHRLIEQALRRADFFLCASERQRDFWLGALLMANRINPYTYDDDESLNRLVSVVPFGLPDAEPQASGPFMRGVHPAVAPSDKIVLWGGGIWNWLDPLTLIRAIAQVAAVHPEVKLVFPGTKHPNDLVPDMEMRQRAVALAESLGLLERHVFFGDWVPYNERVNYLLEADIGVSLHFSHVETRMALRTRLLDYIWVGLPMVVSRGDVTADWVEKWGIGAVVDCEDVEGVAEAICRLLAIPQLREHYSSAFARAARSLTWERVAEPLRAYCQAPYRAGDARARSAQDRLPRAVLESDLASTRSEVNRWRELVRSYENGRFIRTMKRLAGWRARLSAGSRQLPS